MAYDALIAALLEEGRTKSETIVRTAQIEAERLLNDARQQWEILDSEAEAGIRQDLAAQRTAILSRATLSARHVLLETKREILDAVWRHADQKAMTLTGKARTQVLSALLVEVLSASSSPSPRVVIDGRERPYLEDILRERGSAVEEQHQDDLLLGVRLEANGEVFTNCYATRLAKAKPELMIELNRLLFSDGGQHAAISNQSSGKSQRPIAES